MCKKERNIVVMKKEVLVIFKTHLDIGFTDYANNILQKYLKEYIPNAIRVGYELKDTDTPFVWTVGSWLIWQALGHDTEGVVERAVRDGILRWHALPFTTHTELMGETLFEYGLSLSQKLDERFGTKTTGAKMSDVPGHTLGVVPMMKKHGIRFLHLGVNPATPLPKVPPVFRWRCGEDEIVVMYQGDYGEEVNLGECILSFAHTGDNLGPQDAKQVIEVYRQLREKYPDHNIRVGTIDDLACEVLKIQNLPVVEDEIGDTWIHGIGTDPEKVSRFKKVERALQAWQGELPDLSDTLLCVPEHTWGLDIKNHFPYADFYSHQDILRMRSEAERVENSWDEQRDYVRRAEELLSVTPDYPIKKPDTDAYLPVKIPENLPFEVTWQLFDNADYERYKRDYMRLLVKWSVWDFTKVGLPDYEGGIFHTRIYGAYQKGEEMLYHLAFDEVAKVTYGLPDFYLSVCGETVTLKWFDKKPSRLPQAFWFKFKGQTERWELHKMGLWLSPSKIIGSPFISAIDRGVRNDEYTIESLDCALVAPYGRKLLQYGERPETEDLYFNLYNNIWNTNFPMWYSDDALFRFFIKKR